jgi:hypothetical protein
MANKKGKRSQRGAKQKQQPHEEPERQVQRGRDVEGAPERPVEGARRRRPGEGLDKSDEGVIAGGWLAGRRFTG